jgi:hypothetical protein
MLGWFYPALKLYAEIPALETELTDKQRVIGM